MTIFGVHAGLQNIALAELRSAWRTIEDLGFDWISVWDHFYAATLTDGAECWEAVATHAALACDTSRVTVGCLVYSVGYRHPAVLAKAITAIDHLSGGRAAMGIGAGWSKVEYDAYGIPFPSVGTRMDQLAEGIEVLRGLLHEPTTTHAGEWFQVTDARNEPRPVQAKLPIWVGGGGEQRTLRIVARSADGWNVPFVDPAGFARKRSILHGYCESLGRDPGEIRCAVNVGLAWTEESLREQFGGMADYVRPGVLTGSDDQALARIQEYVDAGADQVNIAIRAPFDLDAVARLAGALGLSA